MKKEALSKSEDKGTKWSTRVQYWMNNNGTVKWTVFLEVMNKLRDNDNNIVYRLPKKDEMKSEEAAQVEAEEMEEEEEEVEEEQQVVRRRRDENKGKPINIKVTHFRQQQHKTNRSETLK